MSNRNMKRRKCPPFVRLDRAMVDSDAFNDLRPTSVVVLVSILRRHNGFNGTKDDPIICPYSAMKGGISTATIAKGIRDLEEHGFIKRIRYGGLMKQPNTYELLFTWRQWKPDKNERQLQKMKRSGLKSEAMGVLS